MNWLTSRGAPLVALTALALASCDKGTDLNVDLPNTSVIRTEYTDLDVDAATVQIAPTQTLKADHYLTGKVTDNLAGNIETKAYINLITGTPKDSLPTTPRMATPMLDSVVVVMGFDKVTGTTAAPVSFDVLNLQAPLDERQAYDSRSTVATAPTPLGQNLTSRLDRTVRVKVNATATTPEYTTTVVDQTVRLVLQRRAAAVAPYGPAPAVASPFFSTTFFSALKVGPNFSQAQLGALLNGLAIVPSAGYTGSIVHFTRGFNGRLAFFFHDDALPLPTPPLTRKWHSYSFFFGPVFSGSGAGAPRDPRYFTYISNDFSGSSLSQLVDPTQAVASTSPLLNGVSYLQEGVGLGTRVTFKGLEQLRATTGITINRAELRVPVKPFSNIIFPNPNQVYALEVDANNRILQRILNYMPTDRVVQADGTNQLATGSPSFASLQNASSTQPYYNLLITSYLQAYLTDKLDGNPASLVLVPNVRASNELTLNRATIDAANIRLRVYYSKR